MFNIIRNICGAIVFVTLVAAIPMGILANLPGLSVLASFAVALVVFGFIEK